LFGGVDQNVTSAVQNVNKKISTLSIAGVRDLANPETAELEPRRPFGPSLYLKAAATVPNVPYALVQRHAGGHGEVRDSHDLSELSGVVLGDVKYVARLQCHVVFKLLCFVDAVQVEDMHLRQIVL